MKMVNLEIYGFDSNSSKVFNYLLQNVGNYRSVTAKLISDNLDMPPKAVYQSLKQLEKEGLAESSELDYPKLFTETEKRITHDKKKINSDWKPSQGIHLPCQSALE